ncbi:MAG TPA: hypothetical protein ENJ28_08100 [Gammaproteobacteria bacterium]|nr:hypothetical protein [Gammaproteobacteria bacterium]
MRRFIPYFFIFFFYIPHTFASDNTFPIVKGSYQLSLENILLPGAEEMGLMGGNYLIETSYLTTGLGIYGAVTGDRGGFFTGGFHLAKLVVLPREYFFEANVFAGGGGGGAAPQGGGLMLRAALGLGKQINNHRYFLGLSQVSFPNGDINSRQMSFAYTYLFKKMHFPGWEYEQSPVNWDKLFSTQSIHIQQVSMQLLDYFPAPSVLGRNGLAHNKRLSTLGIRFSKQINQLLWGEFETAGAMRGGIDGFAQVFGGFSLKQKISQRLSLSSGWLLGAAGGGNVDTGGGSMSRIFAGVEIDLYRRWSSYLQLGYIFALDGAFSAKTVNFNLVYSFENIMLSPKVAKNSVRSKIRSLHWRRLSIRPGVQKYTFYQQPARKFNNQKNLDVDLTILKLDAYFSSQFYVSGQALGAFRGKAGGYAVGLLGPGFRLNQFLSTELLFGVAGGGGIDVGSGKLIQPMINFDVKHSNVWSTELSAGYVKAYDGKLSAFVFNLGVAYRFSHPYY